MQINGAEQTAEHRAENKAQAHHGTQQTKPLGALLRRRDVRHIGAGDSGIGLHGTAHNAPSDQPGEGGGQRGAEKAQRQTQKAQQQHAATAKMV